MAHPKFSVTVRPRYIEAQSDPEQHHYFFAYTVTVRNTGDTRAQLRSRHWIITDANGEVEEVRGEGVIGMQPILEPGESFEYTSACPLRTPVGTMRGTYQCVTANGEPFEADIPEFVLTAPRTLH